VRAIHQDDSLTGRSLAHFRLSSATPEASPSSEVRVLTWDHAGSKDRFRVAGSSAAIASLRDRISRGERADRAIADRWLTRFLRKSDRCVVVLPLNGIARLLFDQRYSLFVIDVLR